MHISKDDISKIILVENLWSIMPKIDGIQIMHVIRMKHIANEINLWHVQESKEPDALIKNYCLTPVSINWKPNLLSGN